MLWVVWLSQNDIEFDKSIPEGRDAHCSKIHVGYYKLSQWRFLSSMDDGLVIDQVYEEHLLHFLSSCLVYVISRGMSMNESSSC